VLLGLARADAGRERGLARWDRGGGALVAGRRALAAYCVALVAAGCVLLTRRDVSA
jgi:hypothetical protein